MKKFINMVLLRKDSYHVIENGESIFSYFQGTFNECFDYWTSHLMWEEKTQQNTHCDIVHTKRYTKIRKNQVKQNKDINKRIIKKARKSIIKNESLR